MLESAMNDFLSNNPDPMDERHPIKALPQCNYGQLLKIILRTDNFVSKVDFLSFPNNFIVSYFLPYVSR